MYRPIVMGLVAASALLITGCSSQPRSAAVDSTVSLVSMGPAQQNTFFFGVGDMLGEQIYAYYVATLDDTEEFYATGQIVYPND